MKYLTKPFSCDIILVIMDKDQRKGLSKALYDVGKLVIAMLVLGPVISPEKFNLTLFILGTVIFLILFISATILNKEE